MANEPLDNNEMLESPDNFETIYETHSKSIYRFLFWQTKDVQLSEDLTSSVFEKAWRSRASFKGGSSQAWLYRIARNVLIDHWRKKKDLSIVSSDNLDESAVSMDKSLDTTIQIEKMHIAMEKLPKEMSEVITARFIDGMSGKQVAKKLNLTESNVRVIQYRGLKKLKGYLK